MCLSNLQNIYEIERANKSMNPLDRKLDRLAKVKPHLDNLKSWVEEECESVAKSAIGKAMSYTQSQWHKLYNLLEDGRLEIDNNLIENKSGHWPREKNYLFAGSHDGAKELQ
ncbi:MAG: transposase [Saprospiraceae bacterium]|nr:transposase [Saprospiraceae bacterium]